MLRFILKLESIFLNFYDLCTRYKNQFISKYYNEKVLHLALYYKHSYITIYNYDNIYILIYIWLFNLYKNYSMLCICNLDDIPLDIDDILMISYVKDNKINRKFINYELTQNLENHKSQPKFIYAIVDETIDMTQDFENFKELILINKKLSVYDIIFMMSSFKNKFIKNNNLKLKIMLDNNYDELVFKAEDLLLINT